MPKTVFINDDVHKNLTNVQENLEKKKYRLTLSEIVSTFIDRDVDMVANQIIDILESGRRRWWLQKNMTLKKRPLERH